MADFENLGYFVVVPVVVTGVYISYNIIKAMFTDLKAEVKPAFNKTIVIGEHVTFTPLPRSRKKKIILKPKTVRIR